MSDLGTVAAEMADASRYLKVVMLACVEHVERLGAEGDDDAATLARLVADAERRCAIARFEAVFAMPPAL